MLHTTHHLRDYTIMATKAQATKNADFAIVLIEDNAALDKAIKSIATRGVSLQKDVHQAACSVLHKVNCNGDVRIVDTLLAAMPGMARTNSLKLWFETFGPIAFVNGKTTHSKVDKKGEFPKACKTPFWVLDPEKEYQPLDIVKFLASIQKKLTKDETETGASHTELSTLLTGYAAKLSQAPATDAVN